MRNNKRAVVIATGMLAWTWALFASGPGNFKPSTTFPGNSLTGWHPLGSATWRAELGEYVGSGVAGSGWLVLDKSYQEVQFYANFKCTDPCSAGVLIRAAKTSDGGLRGTFVSLGANDLGAFTLTLDASGKEIGRERVAAPAGRGGAAGPPADVRGDMPGGRADASAVPPAGRGRAA